MVTDWACKIEMRKFEAKCREIGGIPGWSLYAECRVRTVDGARQLLAERLDSPYCNIERFTGNEIIFSMEGQRYRHEIVPIA